MYPIFSLECSATLETLRTWIKEFGCPQKILTDRGKQFLAKEYSNYLNGKGIKPCYTAVENPQGNGIVEKTNSTITNLLRIYKGKDLNSLKRIIERRLNLTFNFGLGKVPIELIKGFNPIDVTKRTKEWSDKEKARAQHKKDALRELKNRNRLININLR